VPDLEPDPSGPAAPDPLALRRRVLLAAALTLLSFVVLGYLVTAVGGPPWLLLPALVLVLVLVVRPLMAPVLAANRLRRRLAYQAFRDAREDDGG
jgi:small-conductance mechanosensitive channel